MAVVVEAVNVSKTYLRGPTEVNAVRGVSLAVRAGEIVAIVGPSGSGKSTLLTSAPRGHGCALIMVTHEPTAARAANRVVEYMDGQLIGDRAQSTAAGLV